MRKANCSFHHFHIDHRVYPAKFCKSIVFNFSWVLQSSQVNTKTMVMQYFGQETECIMVYGKMALSCR